MNKETNKKDPLFIINDKAYIMIKSLNISLSSYGLIGMYLIGNGFQPLLEHNNKVIIPIVLLSFILIINSIKLISVLYRKDKKIEFYEDRIVRTYKNKEMFVNRIIDIQKFRALVQYEGARLRLEGFVKFFYYFIFPLAFITMVIAFPQVLIGVVFLLVFYFIAVVIYSYIENKNFQIFNISMIEISMDNKTISLILDNTNETKKIEDYFNKYLNKDLNSISKNFTFKNRKDIFNIKY